MDNNEIFNIFVVIRVYRNVFEVVIVLNEIFLKLIAAARFKFRAWILY